MNRNEIIEALKSIQSDYKDYFISLFKERSDLYSIHIFISTILNKALNIIEEFFNAFQNNNIFVIPALIRMQADNCMATYALSVIDDDIHSVLIDILNGKKRIRDYKDFRTGKKLNDSYLHSSINNDFPKFSEMYEWACSFVHFSKYTINASIKSIGDMGVEGRISSNNDKYDEVNIINGESMITCSRLVIKCIKKYLLIKDHGKLLT